MPLLPGCPAWEYKYHPDYAPVLQHEAAALFSELRRGQLDCAVVAKDTRPAHLRLFATLVCPGFAYYAGHYRGSSHYCLRLYECGIPGDPLVGAQPQIVDHEMTGFAVFLTMAFSGLDRLVADPKTSDGDKLKHAVAVAACAFERFLRVHPYANGNGHAARLCVVAILGRYGYWPSRWTVDPRPPLPTYDDAIYLYRRGQYEPLERLILSCI
jgi:hypothetical protein